MSMFSRLVAFFSSKNSTTIVRRKHAVKLGVEKLEDRLAPAAAAFVETSIEHLPILPGAQGMVVSDFVAVADSWQLVDKISFKAAPQSASLQSMSCYHLYQDTNLDGQYETDLGRATANANRVTFSHRFVIGSASQASFRLTADAASQFSGTKFGVDVASIHTTAVLNPRKAVKTNVYNVSMLSPLVSPTDLSVSARYVANPANPQTFFMDVSVSNISRNPAANVTIGSSFGPGVVPLSPLPPSLFLSGGQSMTYRQKFSFTPAGSVPPGFVSEISFDVRSASFELDLSNNRSQPTRVVAPVFPTDVTVSYGAPNSVRSGEAFTTSILVSNNSRNVTADNVFVTVNVPMQLAWNAQGTDPAWRQPSEFVRTLSVGSLQPGQIRVFSLGFTAQPQSQLTTVAIKASVTTSTPETNLGNNASTVTVGVQPLQTGLLFVTAGITPVRPQFLLGGTSVHIGSLEFRADGEPIDVTNLQLSIAGDGASSIDNLELYLPGSLSPFAIASVGGSGTDIVPTVFNGNPVLTFSAQMLVQQLVVPNNAVTTVIVRALVKTDVDGGQTGKNVSFVLVPEPVVNYATGQGTVKGRGVVTHNNLFGDNITIGSRISGPDLPVAGPIFLTAMSRIDSIVNANPDANGTNVSTGVSDIGQFKITAATHGNSKNGLDKVVVDRMTFIVTAENVDLDVTSFRLFNKANSTLAVVADSVEIVSSGVYRVTFSALSLQASVDTAINQGSSQTFVLQANVISATQSSSLRVGLQTDNLFWSDRDASTNFLFGYTLLPDTIMYSTLYQS